MPTGATNLGTQLGQLLFGRPDDGKAYMEGQALGALSEDRMQSAAKSRAAAMIDQDRLTARQGITPQAMIDAGYADGQAPLLGNLLRANDKLDLRDLGALQAPTAGAALADASTAMHGGNLALGNALLALAGGKPIETTRVTDGQVFNPYGESTQAVPLTALGDATVGEKHASATDKLASAGEHRAHASLYDTQREAGGFNPHTGKGGSGNPSTPSPALLGALLGRGYDDMGRPIIDQDKMRRFLAFQANNAATDPRYNDGDFAAREWAAQNENPPVVTLPEDLSRLGEATVAGAPTTPVASKPSPRKAPAAGTSEGGYIFKGGDPSKKENWVKASDLTAGAAQ